MPLLLLRFYKIAHKMQKTLHVARKVVFKKTWKRMGTVILLMDHFLNKNKERPHNKTLNFMKKNKNNLLIKLLSLK